MHSPPKRYESSVRRRELTFDESRLVGLVFRTGEVDTRRPYLNFEARKIRADRNACHY